MIPVFEGLGVALATPFLADGQVDLPAFKKLVAHVRDGGVDFLVALGSTGEAATLRSEERDAVLKATIEMSEGRPVVAGTGSNATHAAVDATRRARELGASGALVVVPYYNKPTPRGLLAHFDAIIEANPGFPLIAYNVPSRTGLNLDPDTLFRLFERDEIVGVKESSGDLAQIAAIGRGTPKTKRLLAGDDHLFLPTTAVGGTGLISVTGNLLPAQMAELVRLGRAGRFAEARELEARLAPLVKGLFVESNPIPLKAGLAHLGLGLPHLRLPLTDPTEATTRLIQGLLDGLTHRNDAVLEAAP